MREKRQMEMERQMERQTDERKERKRKKYNGSEGERRKGRNEGDR